MAEVERSFDSEDVRATIICACFQRGPSSRGLKYLNLQAAIPVPLGKNIEAFSKTVLNSETLPDFLWSLYTHATLSRLGEKVHPSGMRWCIAAAHRRDILQAVQFQPSSITTARKNQGHDHRD